jgi:serine/threonine-protein kinase HipA
MRKAKVFVDENIAGSLVEDDEGLYIFTYDENYKKEPVSLTLPLKKEPYKSKVLFPCFDGLIPEGWMLNIVSKNWKINHSDRMGLLLVCCYDCIGCVRIEKDE